MEWGGALTKSGLATLSPRAGDPGVSCKLWNSHQSVLETLSSPLIESSVFPQETEELA